jgi:hypothetical protein
MHSRLDALKTMWNRRILSYVGGMFIILGNFVPWWCVSGFTWGCSPKTEFSLADNRYTNYDVFFVILMGLVVTSLTMDMFGISKDKIIWAITGLIFLVFLYMVVHNQWVYSFVDFAIVFLSALTAWLAFRPHLPVYHLRRLALVGTLLLAVSSTYRIMTLLVEQFFRRGFDTETTLQFGLPLILSGALLAAVSRGWDKQGENLTGLSGD